jgi:release factor H-coupled RctB family protein
MKKTTAEISLFTTATTWVEGESIRQLERVAALPGKLRVAGFPDLHPGKGGPVGAAMLSEGIFYPYLVGSDVGCGMMLCSTDFDSSKAKPEKWAKKLKGLEEPLSADEIPDYLMDSTSVAPDMYPSFGTIGLGNHFVEILKIKDVYNEVSLRFSGIKKSELALLVHSGSRGYGEKLLRSHVDTHRDGGLFAGSEEAKQYLAAHDRCVAWARHNRFTVACRLFRQIDPDAAIGWGDDWCHNSITVTEYDGKECFLHRKGAAPTDEMHVVIPGSRGSLTYLVKPTWERPEENLWSLAHGAGRKWSRSECEGRLRERYSADSFRKTRLGSYVICDDKPLLYEEAPQAYKDIDSIIADLVSFGLIEVVATFIPLLTYKVRGR